MKRNTEELKEKLISVGIEEIRTNGIDRMSMRYGTLINVLFEKYDTWN